MPENQIWCICSSEFRSNIGCDLCEVVCPGHRHHNSALADDDEIIDDGECGDE